MYCLFVDRKASISSTLWPVQRVKNHRLQFTSSRSSSLALPFVGLDQQPHPSQSSGLLGSGLLMELWSGRLTAFACQNI